MQFRTDLAREALAGDGRMSGVAEQVRRINGIEISRIRIETEAAAKKLGKPKGIYTTIEIPDSVEDMTDLVVERLAGELRVLMGSGLSDVLVIGLGNRFVTPDSLGPRTVEKLFVTRHIKKYVPEAAPKHMRAVSAIAPGVLGVTGLETVEVVQGLIANARPSAVLCVDALSSLRTERITNVIQLNDNGLLPGAGVGNRQKGLDRDTLGVPVFAIGVPTVVYASTIARQTVKLLEEQTGAGEDGGSLAGLAEQLVEERMENMIVTPKDIDQLIEDASLRLSRGINLALHGSQYAEIEALLTH